MIVPRSPEGSASRPLTAAERIVLERAIDAGGRMIRRTAGCGVRARSARGTSRRHPHDRDPARGVRRVQGIPVTDVDVHVVDRAVVVPVVEHQVAREETVVAEGTEAGHVGRRPLRERPAGVGTRWVPLPLHAAPSFSRRSHQARPEQSNPGTGWPPRAAGGFDPPHSPPHTYGRPTAFTPQRTMARRFGPILGKHDFVVLLADPGTTQRKRGGLVQRVSDLGTAERTPRSNVHRLVAVVVTSPSRSPSISGAEPLRGREPRTPSRVCNPSSCRAMPRMPRASITTVRAGPLGSSRPDRA